jgi:tetratricopeptide (TPR) repeat protein
MLETIREFAAERLEESGEDDVVRRAHVDFFLALAEAAEPALWGPEQAAWLGRLEDDRDNLRAALAWSLDRGTAEAETGLRLATALSMFWWLRGPLSEGSGRLAQALALSGKAPAASRLRALDGASGLAYQQGDLPRTIAFAEEMLALARQIGDAASTSRSLEQLAVAAQALDDHARAVRLYEELQAVSLERGDPQGEATANLGLGWSLHARGDHVAAAVRLAAALDGFRRLGDHNRTAMALLLDALAGRDTGALGTAAVRFREAIALLDEIGDTVHLVGVVAGLASAAAIDRRSTPAARLFGAAEALSEAVGAPFPTWFPPERARCEKAIADARTALGSAAFSVAWDAGRALPQEAAIAEALALADEIAAAVEKADA